MASNLEAMASNLPLTFFCNIVSKATLKFSGKLGDHFNIEDRWLVRLDELMRPLEERRSDLFALGRSPIDGRGRAGECPCALDTWNRELVTRDATFL